MSLRRIKIALCLLAATLPSSALAQQGSWKCSAPRLQSGSYDGGATAYIHLSPYPNGKHYAVSKQGKVANGVTSDGTKFTCKQS